MTHYESTTLSLLDFLSKWLRAKALLRLNKAFDAGTALWFLSRPNARLKLKVRKAFIWCPGKKDVETAMSVHQLVSTERNTLLSIVDCKQPPR